MSLAFRSVVRAQPWVILVAALACASGPKVRPDLLLEPLPVNPGAGLGGQPVILLPLSTIQNGDPLGWAASIQDARTFLVTTNTQIEHALTTQAQRTQWILPAALSRIVARHAGYAHDPYTLDVTQFDPATWHRTTKLNDPLEGDLRTLTSLTDARLVVIPVELRFIPVPKPPVLDQNGKPKPPAPVTEEIAVIRLALVDTPFSLVGWTGDVTSIPSATLTPAVMESLINHLGDELARP